MAKLTWEKPTEHMYETGVRNCALYVYDSGSYGTGVEWNGVTAITESPSGAEATPLYADDGKYLNLISAEEFGATIEAYTYPEEFAACNGEASLGDGVVIGQQARKKFALAYKTRIGNEEGTTETDYKLHIVYGCQAAPSERAYATVNDSPEAITFSWELTTTPVAVTGAKPTSIVTIDSTKIDSAKLATIEAQLFGDTDSEPTLLLPDEIKAILTNSSGSDV